VPGGYNTAVVLPVEGGGTEVDELDPSVAHSPDCTFGCGTYLCVPVGAEEQNVLRFKICMGEMVLVQKLK